MIAGPDPLVGGLSMRSPAPRPGTGFASLRKRRGESNSDLRGAMGTDNGGETMEKLKLDTLEVESFATAGAAPARLGTVQANQYSGLPCDLTHNGCPTQYCATYPLGTCGGA